MAEGEREVHLGVMEVTQFGVFHPCEMAAKQMVKQVREGRKGGKIIISSLHQEVAFRDSACYNMAKAAVNHLGLTLAAELACYHIPVNVVNPGWIDTPGERAGYGDSAVDEGGKYIPWGRLSQPDDIARAVAFLASDDADYVTGATLLADGSMKLNPAVNVDNIEVWARKSGSQSRISAMFDQKESKDDGIK